jgi:uncharacterized protein
MSSSQYPSPRVSSPAILLALSPLIDLFIGTIPILNIIAPLIVWLWWRDKDQFIDRAGRSILNSQISWTIWLALSHIICGVLTLILIGWLIIWIVPLLWAIFTIVQCVKVINGDTNYVMPCTIKFLK